jgi:hypothetical protein
MGIADGSAADGGDTRLATIADTAPEGNADTPPLSTIADTAAPSPDTADSGTNANSDTDTGAPSAILPFIDTFDGGYAANWVNEVVNGNADPVPTNASNGSNHWITLDATSSNSGFARIHTIQQFPAADLSASVSFRIEQAPISTRTVRLDIRQSSDTPNVFYAVGATVGSDGSVTKIGLFKKVPDNADPGNYTICALTDPNALKLTKPLAMNQWITIKLTITGTVQASLSAYFVDAQLGDVPAATYVDDCTSPIWPTDGRPVPVPNWGCLANQTGLGIQIDRGIVASFDDVLVTTP